MIIRNLPPRSFIDDRYFTARIITNISRYTPEGAGATMGRMAMFEADLPLTVPIYAVNRQCASGLQAVASIAASISRYLIPLVS